MPALKASPTMDKVQPTRRNGAAMATKNSRHRSILLGGCFFLMATATFVINLPQMFFGPLPLLFRVSVPVLLAAGFLGSALRRKFLRLAGWIGICCLVLTVLLAFPTEDYVLGGPGYPPTDVPRLVSVADVLWRLAVILGLSVLIIGYFWKLGKTSSRNDRDVSTVFL